MNGAFLHLAVNHIPVVGLPFCFLMLAAAVLRKSRDLLQAGFAGVVLVALIMFVVYKSGGPAARIVKGMTGVTQEHIHDHAEAADDAAGWTEVLGGGALLCLWLLSRPKGVPNWLTALMLAGSLGVSIWLGYVAHLGGLIRHPEVEINLKEKMP